MNRAIRLFIVGFLGLVMLSACSNPESQRAELKRQLVELRKKPKGHIDPPPQFKTYENFLYSAMLLRSPFQKPIREKQSDTPIVPVGPRVEPDFSRPKEVLEYFSLEALAMVGTIKKEAESLFALVKDSNGIVYPIKPGNYMGKNYGKVVIVNERSIDLIEIIPDGQQGWIERPRTVVMADDFD